MGEEQAQQGPHHLAGREAEQGPARQLGEHVQDGGDVFQAHQVSARLNRTAAAWRNLMTYRRCRVSPISTRGRETSSPTCGRIWWSLVEWRSRILKRPPVDGLQFSTSRRGATPVYRYEAGGVDGRPQEEEAWPSPLRAQQ